MVTPKNKTLEIFGMPDPQPDGTDRHHLSGSSAQPGVEPPFRYGIAAMTELPHAFVLLRGSVDGAACCGLASEKLPPQWFTKDPGALR